MIARSSAVELSSVPNQDNLADQQNYSPDYPRRLQAEVLLDAIDDVTGSRTEFRICRRVREPSPCRITATMLFRSS